MPLLNEDGIIEAITVAWIDYEDEYSITLFVSGLCSIGRDVDIVEFEAEIASGDKMVKIDWPNEDVISNGW